ncbi:hypothetical protein [Xenorhabdus ishibashii]|uniref:Uncharacterized protein n=1 Tax=Xenorhabdus ishibashii TaxID=1034471 RepID=A0A2D0KAK8_9GAMM|nr:hypothetical protein [Xenorhabdus ishibashii]PHM60375.1 hypothetical protein Xish_03522 [Xenorhabdus ishibashii]
MAKNVIFLFGMLEEIEKYIEESLNSESGNENIYLTLVLLTEALNLESMEGIKKFYSDEKLDINDEVLEKFKKNLEFFIQLSTSLIEKKIQLSSIKTMNMFFKTKHSKELLDSFLNYIHKNKDKLSIQKSLKKQKDKKSENYCARFFNKNTKNTSIDIYNNITIFIWIKEIINIFINNGDKDGFEFLMDFKKNKEIYKYHNKIYNGIIDIFRVAFIRKLSKLTLSWVDEETKKPENNIIDRMKFITDYINDSDYADDIPYIDNDNYVDNNNYTTNVNDFLQSRSLNNIDHYSDRINISYKTIGKNYYPITFSEYHRFSRDYSQNEKMEKENINIRELAKRKVWNKLVPISSD